MRWRRDALILLLWLLALASAVAALLAGRGYLVPALVFGSLAAYASYRRTR
jgi:uncharacterized membrane protein YiaA